MILQGGIQHRCETCSTSWIGDDPCFVCGEPGASVWTPFTWVEV